MTREIKKTCLRKAALLCLCALGLAALVSATDATSGRSNEPAQPEPLNNYADQTPLHQTKSPHDDFDASAEANRAFKQAMFTLQNITSDQHQYTFDPSSAFSAYNPKSLLASFLPNPESTGPLANALRLLNRVRQSSLVRGLYGSMSNPATTARQARREHELKRKSVKVLDLLQFSAELGHQEALYVLAQVSMFPPNDFFPSDPALAYRSLSAHASATGNASSQALLAFFHSTGYHDIVPVNQAMAQLYYTFAANGGHKGAQMALGYRYLTGIGTLESCDSALKWYEYASDQAMELYSAGPLGGRTLPLSGTRLSDLVGGVFGYGSSVASTGPNIMRPGIKAGLARAAGETWEEVLQYYMFNANRGELDFAYRLGKIYYQGSIYPAPGGIASGGEGVGAVPQSYQKAMYYFLLVARKLWPKDPANPLNDKPAEVKEETGAARYGIPAAGYIGRMYMRGEGVKRDYAQAKMWFSRGAEFGDRECQNGLGILHRDGLIPGKKADPKEAKKYFVKAANDGLAEAQVNLAKLSYDRGDIPAAATIFDSAIRSGSSFEAYYYLGIIQSSNVAAAAKSTGPSVSGSCPMAVSFHKQVAERGTWDENLVKEGEVAWMSGTDRSKEVALLKWWIAAERGQEIAQNNLAYVLDQDRSVLRLTRFSPITPSNDTARLALTQWTRAAGQRNIDALVKVGDYYYHGLGVPPDSEADRYEKAAKFYQSAADTHLSALAMWNLGWMYENGIGVHQDFHLAKRNYDLALETNSEAYLPVLLSLFKLYARSLWHTLQGGQDGLSIWDFEEDQEFLSQHNAHEIESSPQDDEGNQLEDGDDGTWYFGKAREELWRRTQQNREDEADHVEWARERRLQEQEAEGDFGPEDFFDATLRGGNREPQDSEEFFETIILVLLCLMISVLIYVRTRIVDERRREQQNQGDNQPPQAAQNNLGR